MARITVEDCLKNVDNLFQLVLLASQRARRLANGAEPTVRWRTTSRPWWRCARSPPAMSPPRCSASPNRPPEPRSRTRRTNPASARPSSGWGTEGLPARPMDYASSLLGLFPGGRRTPGLKELLAAVGKATCRPTRSSASGGGRVRCFRPQRTKLPLRRAVHRPPGGRRRDPRRPAPGCRYADRGDPARRHRRHPDAKDQLAARFGADVAEWSTGSPSSTRSSSRAARKRRQNPSARCCWRWSGTCG